MSQLLYNSLDEKCKSPFGAVPAGTPIKFCVAVRGSFSKSPLLRVFCADKWDSPILSTEMTLAFEHGGDSFFETNFTPSSPALLFYDFMLDGFAYRRSPSGEAVCDLCAHWQLTVYDGEADFPSSWGGGIMYQIFPDRFAQAEGCGSNPFGDRRFHKSPSELPDYETLAPELVNKDYFGGNLRGIEGKLDYLSGLSVTCIYLNPIFESHSNHRYDTADYMKVDPLLGTEEDFRSLCRAAGERGIKVILDGVFNHTGADSVYFNRFGRYPSSGAWQRGSRYDSWFEFGRQFPNGYRSWWGFPNLPELNENDASLREFICGDGGVIDHWMEAGASGFRLDVADELPDDFICEIRRAVKRHGSDKLLLGEVWEDASQKIAYSVRREYLLGRELDSVMNYPFRDAVLDWLGCGGGELLRERIFSICENYPAPVLNNLMNLLSTHDTVRALTVLGCESCDGRDRAWQAARHFPDEHHYSRGKAGLILASVMQFFLPGIPCIYYGEEVGMYGYKDPFNRCFFPWGDEDADILSAVQALGRIRNENSVFRDGTIHFSAADDNLCVIERSGNGQKLAAAINRSETSLPLPSGLEHAPLLFGALNEGRLPARSAAIFKLL